LINRYLKLNKKYYLNIIIIFNIVLIHKKNKINVKYIQIVSILLYFDNYNISCVYIIYVSISYISRISLNVLEMTHGHLSIAGLLL